MYPELCPLDFERIDGNLLSRVTLPGNQLLKYKQDGRELLFFDETHNPTNSYKDRASILVALKAKELGITEIAAASTGNAGSSLAGICARLGIKAHIFVPKNIPEAKRIQIQAFGANIYLVDGDYDQAYDLSLKISNDKGWYNRNTAYNPLTIEGKKSAAFDMYIQTKGDLPDKIFVPVGDGVIISGLYKGFLELMKLGLIDKLPQLIAVQAEGSSAVIDYLTTGEFIYKPAHTIADSISAGAPRNLYVASKAVKETKGFGIKVNDEELLKAQKELSYKFGLLTEPSSASVYAAYNSVAEKLSDSERVMLLITGSGLKDFESLKLWNEKPAVRTSGEWKEYLTGTKSNI
jgi:threonine synthase